ncbi:hypothetical protein HIM_07472 [Hirsutella minnesotensis 3608]|uniref:Alpha-type protein kinase domain-containing protein n=1 Tax=Hirsutella minnesotensis 3608 TaxID=1043627 RepID=A0A0F7ZTG8_9HYPO|nr:hypothetical protein HIM_07472 [Hirsutella minnesotensis 3608]
MAPSNSAGESRLKKSTKNVSVQKSNAGTTSRSGVVQTGISPTVDTASKAGETTKAKALATTGVNDKKHAVGANVPTAQTGTRGNAETRRSQQVGSSANQVTRPIGSAQRLTRSHTVNSDPRNYYGLPSVGRIGTGNYSVRNVEGPLATGPLAGGSYIGTALGSHRGSQVPVGGSYAGTVLGSYRGCQIPAGGSYAGTALGGQSGSQIPYRHVESQRITSRSGAGEGNPGSRSNAYNPSQQRGGTVGASGDKSGTTARQPTAASSSRRSARTAADQSKGLSVASNATSPPQSTLTTDGGRRNKSFSAAISYHSIMFPFAEGTFRYAGRGTYTSGERKNEACVVKWFKDRSDISEDWYKFDIMVTSMALEIINEFNKLKLIPEVIKINMPEVWKSEDVIELWSGRRTLVEPFIQNWKKFNSNSGWNVRNDKEAYGLQALSHFSYHVSGGKHVLCDLQGGLYVNQIILSDPVILSRTREFGVTDLGPDGITQFFNEHKCNKYCKNWLKPQGPKTQSTVSTVQGTTMRSLTSQSNRERRRAERPMGTMVMGTVLEEDC